METATDGAPPCGDPMPRTDNLACLKPRGHSGPHTTCLGYHPPPDDVYEWAEWSDGDNTVLSG